MQSGAKVVLSKLPIGDVATQYFADRDVFCAGRVSADDMKRTMKACGGSVQSTVNSLEGNLGTCGKFEEVCLRLTVTVSVRVRACVQGCGSQGLAVPWI